MIYYLLLVDDIDRIVILMKCKERTFVWEYNFAYFKQLSQSSTSLYGKDLLA